MASYPNDLRYTKNHEWVRDGDELQTVGVTEHVVERLGAISFVELPYPGELFQPDKPFGRASSPTGSWGIHMPVVGKVLEVNQPIGEAPGAINTDPYGDGWIVCIEVGDRAELESLMDASEYEAFVAAAEE